MSVIPLKEWAKKAGISDATARQRAIRGTLPAFKMGRDWMIEEDAENIDHRAAHLSNRHKEKQSN